MSTLFDPERFNLAHQTRRYPPWSWFALAMSTLMLMASLYPLRQSMHALEGAEAKQREFNQSFKRQAANARKAKLEKSSLTALENDKAQRQLQDFVHMSWDGIFDALEVAVDAVRSGVSIVALVPAKVQPTAIQLNITALASNTPIMLAYLKALKSDPRIVQLELTTQQPDEKSGPGVIRFQFNVVCNPQIRVAHPPRLPLPSAMTASVVRPDAIVPPAVLHSATSPGIAPARKP